MADPASTASHLLPMQHAATARWACRAGAGADRPRSEPRGDRPRVLSRRLANPSSSARPLQSILAQNVGLFQIAYFGATSTDAEPAWQARWDGLVYPPKLVRITLSGADGRERPPIVIR